jgi:Xaa-Pro aminopeptidase
MRETTRIARLKALRESMRSAGLEMVALAPTDNLRYMVGFSPRYDERACLLLVTQNATAMLMPSLNADQARAESGDVEFFSWADTNGPADALRAALEYVGAGSVSTVGIDPEMRADHLLLMFRDIPGAELVTADDLLRSLREVKSSEELQVLERGCRVADDAIRVTLAACKHGASEVEVAKTAADALMERGCEEVLFTTVASGPNGAFPQHQASSRRLQDGDAVLIDIGGRLEGYASDITRMAYVGTPTERYKNVHAIVDRAVAAALEVAAPGVTCDEVDDAVRGVIEDAGFGEHFIHRTGHGLGLSVHEPPWIGDGENAELLAGMVLSVEPGIYLPGEFGVRLEETVQITADGCRSLSVLPRDVYLSTTRL